MKPASHSDAKTSPPNNPASYIERIRERVSNLIAQHGNERSRSLWPEWEARLRDIQERSRDRPEVAISLVGGTGAGKSTLLNALIGVRVLPVSMMRACTAAVCEVSYAAHSFHARIEFIPRPAWDGEVGQLLADFRDAQSDADGEADARPRHEMSRAVRDKLWTVYRPAEDADSSAFDPLNLVEPPEIRQALDAGFAEIASGDEDQFRKEVARYLDSKHRFWPIVASVSIRGPFEPLRDGAKLIDLPGLNDPNEAREAVTKRHLKTCRYVWLVFNMKRGLQRNDVELMQSDDFLRQIVMDGRADSLTFIGTAADDVEVESGIEELGLPEDAGLLDVVAARNRAVRGLVLGQMEEVSLRLAGAAGEQRETGTKLAARFKASKIFTVSAREHMRLSGIAKTKSAEFTDAQTEIPALREHMRQICATYGTAAHLRSLGRQFDQVLAEIRQELRSQQAILINRAEVSERGRKEVRTAVDAARSFLDAQLANVRERLVQDLHAGETLLAERVKRAIERGRNDLNDTVARWERIHHSTLRAVCRRDGVYVGPSGRSDLPAELSKPILDGIAFAWSEFFGERLSGVLEKRTSQLPAVARQYRERLDKALTACGSQTLAASLEKLWEGTEKILHERLAQIQCAIGVKVEEGQRTLYESVPDQVRANMQEAFAKAATEAGTGMKRRVVEILSTHARRVCQVMFDDARDVLLGRVRGLNDWLAGQFDTMTASVTRNAALAAENVVAGGVSAEAVAAERKALDAITAGLSSLQKH